MELQITDCDGQRYNERTFKGRVRGRCLHHPSKGVLEITYTLEPSVREHASQFNVMFKDNDDSLEDDDRKYFSYLTLLQRFQLKWMYGDLWLQKPDNIWKLVSMGLSFISGYALHMITHSCN